MKNLDLEQQAKIMNFELEISVICLDHTSVMDPQELRTNI